MARQPGGYVPYNADEFNERYERVVTPITERNRKREEVSACDVTSVVNKIRSLCAIGLLQLLSKLDLSNKEYGNFSWDADIPPYEPTVLKSKKSWKTREMQQAVEHIDGKRPLMSDPNNIGHSQYK